MKILIRRQLQASQSTFSEQAYEGASLKLGDDANANVVLPGLSCTIIVAISGGGLTLKARGGVLTDGGNKRCKRLTLAVGEQAHCGGYQLSCVDVPAGFDAGLAISGGPDAKARWQQQLNVDQHLPNLRRLGYSLLAIVLLVAAIVPGFSLFDSTRDMARQHAPITDAIWSSGPISSPHSTAGIAAECDACHQTPFVSVTDDSCLSCHSDTHEHVNLAHQSAQAAAAFKGVECAHCHREHNEPAYLSRRDNGLCTHCHAAPDDWAYSSPGKMAAVHEFTKASHPSFKYAYWRPQGAMAVGGWERERVRVALGMTPPPSSSMLKNNHKVHMNPEKVTLENSGRAMVCADCHEATADGLDFKPISMDAHCRSCHELSFDVFNPDIELPHGNLRAALVAMEAHFIREFTDPVLRKERALEKPRRVPGRREAAATCAGSGLDCGLAEAAKEATYQMTKTGCITCHEVADTGTAELMDRWQLHPVRLVSTWFPEARFNHASHRNLKGDPEANCLGCHSAKSSEVATDVLIPNEDNCLGCHDQKTANAAIDCVSCHGFHREAGDRSVLVRDVTHAPYSNLRQPIPSAGKD